MRINDLLKAGAIELGTTAANKAEAIDKLVALHDKVGNLNDVEGYKKDILAREESSTTAIGEGLAVPHAKSAAVKQPALAAMTVPGGVDYEAPDGKPSDLLFMIAATEDGEVHLEILARLMTMLMDPEFSGALRAAKTPEEFLAIIDKKETEKFPEEAAAAAAAAPVKEGYRILAVTACPTGIAHTYMAAEALEQAGAEMGLPLKAETNGSGGAKNILTAAEIAACDGIIVAADKNVEMARFDGKPVLKTAVANGINKPKELIQKIVDGEAPIYHADGAAKENASGPVDDESIGRQIYKHLMNGVSHMLPFVVGGGILVAIAFLIDTIYCAQNGLPYGSDFGTMTAASAWIKTIGGGAMGFMLPILAGFIAQSIADRPGLAPGFVGGYLANIGATWGEPGGNAAGVSAGFLGALAAGFIAGYAVKGLMKACENLPKSLDGVKPMLIYPLCGVAIVGVIMCTINPAFIWLNTAISGWLATLGASNASVILGIILGGMMAIDMGGPINKAAYLFGTGMLATAATAADPATQTMCYESMASVMIGGMVPPIALALACQIFPEKFTKNERSTTATNYVMGLSFITEGAIPFAASDPLHVIPSLVAGSAVAGGLSMLFGCTLMAPHGGIFVFATVGKWYLYLVALAVGAAVATLLLSVLKKDVATKEEIKAEKAAAKAEKMAKAAK